MEVGMRERAVAVVTGGSRGIGAAAAVELGRRGYRVVVNYHSRADAADAVVADIRQVGGDGIAVGGDVRDQTAAERVVSTAVSEFGRLDALICNAATPVTFTPFPELSFDELAGKVRDELAAAYYPVHFAVPQMVAQGAGRMVFVSSDMATRTPFGGGIAHGTAKSALNAFVRYLAVEYGPSGITANVVAPGYVRTENSAANISSDFEDERAKTTPVRRVCLPADVGMVIAQLAADTGGYLTGLQVPVTGGRHLV
jgi:3-oxoacyl-[acyl-carrier protein] reductase